MKKSTATRLACQKSQMEILRVLLPLLPGPVMVQDETGRIILSNQAWNAEEEHDIPSMREIIIADSNGEGLFSIFVQQQTGGIHLSGNARWEQSADELKRGLIALVDGKRVPLPSPSEDDPLAEVKREYNAALVTIEQMISVTGLFKP